MPMGSIFQMLTNNTADPMKRALSPFYPRRLAIVGGAGDLRLRQGSPRGKNPSQTDRRMIMLWTIVVVLLVLWLLGLVSSYTMGGFIHILLVIAVITLLVYVIQGRRAI